LAFLIFWIFGFGFRYFANLIPLFCKYKKFFLVIVYGFDFFSNF
jgi:hypothetical protein